MAEGLFVSQKTPPTPSGGNSATNQSIEAAKAMVERLEQIRDRIASLEGRIAGLEIYTNKVGETTDSMADSVFGLSDALVRCIEKQKTGAVVTFADFLTVLKDIFESGEGPETPEGTGHEVPSGVDGGHMVPSGIEQNPAQNP